MPRITCVKCEIEMSPKKNDVPFLETTGLEKKPYRLWSADLWWCELCGAQVVHGYSKKPLMESFQKGFDDYLMAEVERSGGVIYYSHERRFVCQNS